MAESYRPSFESDSEKEDDKKEGKKDQKKRLAQANLGVLTTHERDTADRPQKLGSELLRPLSFGLPKQAESPEAKQKESDGADEKADVQLTNVASAPHAEQVALPEDLQQAYDELLAAAAEDAVEDDEEALKKKKQQTAELVASEEEPKIDEPAHTEAAFQKIAADPELADLAELNLPDAPAVVGAEFPQDVLKEPHKDQLSPEATTGGNADQEFNDIVANSLDEPAPGSARFHEQEPGERPIDMDAGNGEPPVPPSAGAGGWGDGDNESWAQPAGGLANPGVLKEISDVKARQELDDLYHTSRENGLASAVGLIGLGLVLEHFAAKRRDKKLKKQLNAQNKQLKKTNKTLEREQRAQHTTKHKLERLRSSHERTEAQVHTILPAAHSAEIAAAAAVIAGGEQGKPMTPAQEKVLTQRLRESRELGKAIKLNPELKEMTEVHELKRSLEAAHETVVKQEQQLDGMQHEVNYEHLQSKYADNRGSARSGGSSGGGDDGRSTPMLPSPSHQLDSGLDGEYLLETHAQADKKATTSVVAPIAIATVVVILAAVIVMVYFR